MIRQPLFNNRCRSLIFRLYDVRFFTFLVAVFALVDCAVIFYLVDLFRDNSYSCCDILLRIRSEIILAHIANTLILWQLINDLLSFKVCSDLFSATVLAGFG